jgi:hypothetical protein
LDGFIPGLAAFIGGHVAPTAKLWSDFPSDRWSWFARKKLELNRKSHFLKLRPHQADVRFSPKMVSRISTLEETTDLGN